MSINGKSYLEFGAGDIGITSGRILYDEKEVIGVIEFTEQEPTEIGFTKKLEEDDESKLEDVPVIMTFSKIESIDVVIEQLERCKEGMINLTNTLGGL